MKQKGIGKRAAAKEAKRLAAVQAAAEFDQSIEAIRDPEWRQMVRLVQKHSAEASDWRTGAFPKIIEVIVATYKNEVACERAALGYPGNLTVTAHRLSLAFKDRDDLRNSLSKVLTEVSEAESLESWVALRAGDLK